ncbi:MAG: hypothetical protein HY318_07805 [Armatimonadetes bacterium]|nr:hypothetical protein [Armatimonadota bacterium]
MQGKPFFPFGLFCVAWTREEIAACFDDVAKRGFNTVHSYWAADVCRSRETVQAYLDEAQKRGLKVLPTIGDLGQEAALFREGKHEELERRVRDWIRPFKNHPALLAWYVWDEPNAEGFSAPPDCVRAVSEYVKREDPNHPTFFTFTPWHNLEKLPDYRDCCDVICLDPYVFTDYMGLVPKCLDLAAEHGNNRPVWSLLWGCWNSGSRAPTVEETRCSTYLSLIHGATALLYYGHLTEPGMRPEGGDGKTWQRGLADKEMQQLYEAVEQLGKEVYKLSSVLESPLPQGVVTAEASPATLHFRAYRARGGLVLLAANMGKEAVTVRFRVSRPVKGNAVFCFFSRQPLTVAANTFTDSLAPLATRAYRIPMEKTR